MEQVSCGKQDGLKGLFEGRKLSPDPGFYPVDKKALRFKGMTKVIHIKFPYYCY